MMHDFSGVLMYRFIARESLGTLMSKVLRCRRPFMLGRAFASLRQAPTKKGSAAEYITPPEALPKPRVAP
jgi:hypothetical protein